jgi:hypothetical protein
MNDLKQQLYHACQRHIDGRVDTLTELLRSFQEAANEETKSSAGDKYETGRAMAHLEIEKLQNQLADAQRMKSDLSRVSPLEKSEIIRLGSLVFTSHGNFFIAVNAGEHQVGEQRFFVVSSAAPLAQKMLGLKSGDQFTLNNRVFHIQHVR